MIRSVVVCFILLTAVVGTASAIELGLYKNLTVSKSETDWYELTVDPGVLTVELKFKDGGAYPKSGETDIQLEIYDEDGTTLLGSSKSTNDNECVELPNINGGTYKIRVFVNPEVPGEGQGNYNMGLGLVPAPSITPLMRVADLNTGETQTVELHDGSSAEILLISIEDVVRDNPFSAIVSAHVRVSVNGTEAVLNCANYNLPVTVAGVRIDCPVIKDYHEKAFYYDGKSWDENFWALDKDARFRLWPEGSPLTREGTFSYPINQCWFNSGTHMANEHVPDWWPNTSRIYYHAALDFGGVEGLDEVRAATAGLVMSVENESLPGNYYKYNNKGVVYMIDQRGWVYGYNHLYSIDPAIVPGAKITAGQRLGTLGKTGDSGGWAHLHSSLRAIMPSGRLAHHDNYAFIWEAYVREHSPALLAVAKPNFTIFEGETIILDAGKSRSFAGEIVSYTWILSDGNTATGAAVEKTYPLSGCYSEIVEVTDDKGNIAYDFVTVHVFDKDDPEFLWMQSAYAPSFNINPGDPVTFKVRFFNRRDNAGGETWDFGDGTPREETKSNPVGDHATDGYAEIVHTYNDPGRYIVTVTGTTSKGERCMAHHFVLVDQ